MEKESWIKVVGVIYIIWGVLPMIIIPFFIDFSKISSNIILLTAAYVFSIIFIVGGIGFLKHKNWGRVILIVFSIMSLSQFPIGTVLGALFLTVLFNGEVRSLMR